MPPSVLGERVRMLRRERALTQEELAGRAQVSVDLIKKLEQGQRDRARLDTVERLAAALGATPRDLLAPSDGLSLSSSDPAETMELVARLRASDVDDATIMTLQATCERLCTEYAYRPAPELRAEAHQWLGYVARLLDKRTTLVQHRDLLVIAGWTTLLISCLEYDSEKAAAAEATRLSALSIGQEADHAPIMAWAWEIASWMCHTRRDPPGTIAAARVGQEIAPNSGVAVQLLAHEARALARLGESRDVHESLDSGHALLNRIPRPDNLRNHFVVDPGKFDYYAMEAYRVLGDDDRAVAHGLEVLRAGTSTDGRDLAPMRVAEARITLGTAAVRAGDLDGAYHYGARALSADRRCLPSLLLVANDLQRDMRQRYPSERITREYRDQLRAIRATQD